MRYAISLIWVAAWALPPLAVAQILKPALLTFWVLSSLAFGLFLLATYKGPKTNAVLALLSLVYLLASLAAAGSFYMQGTLPDARFFAHLDLSTLDIALQAYSGPTISVGLHLIVLTLSVLTLHVWRPHRLLNYKFVGPVALATAMLSFAPGHKIGKAFFSVDNYNAYNTRIQAELQKSLQSPKAVALPDGRKPKNLILIYAESLEQTYLDEVLFGDVMPNLREIRADSLRFTEMTQYPGTGWTIAGIVSSQCGLPLIARTRVNQLLVSFEDPFRDVTCFGEFLKDQGYATLYMGGATLEFAGKGAFLKQNGYDTTMGREAFPAFFPQSNWGVHDAQLFEEAGKLRDQLATGPNPYLLTLLTLDTHHPYGHPSAECSVPRRDWENIIASVSCSDLLIANFIKESLQAPNAEDTVIAVVSDHLAMRNTASDLLEQGDRKLLFFIANSGSEQQQITAPGTHFDIGPTLLEAMGFKDQKLGFGQSLLSHPQGGVFAAGISEEEIRSLDLTNLFPSISLPADISTDGERITIGDESFVIRTGKVKHEAQAVENRFVALGVSTETNAQVAISALVENFVEDFTAGDNKYWFVYNDGTQDCEIIPNCKGQPSLSVLGADGQVHITRTGKGPLHISSEELAQALSLEPPAN